MKWLWWLLLLLLLLSCAAGAYFLFLVLFDAGDAFPTTEDRRTGVWVVLGLTILSAGLAALLRRWRPRQFRSSAPRLNPRLERKILAYARKSGGRVTVAEVALNARCTVHEAETALKELERQGVATVLYTANMDAVYVITGFDEHAQAQAQDILNTPGGKNP